MMMMHGGVGSPDHHLSAIAIDDGVLSNRDLLNQLHAVAVGIRDFVTLGARLELTQLIVEVKNELLLVAGNAKSFSTEEYATKSKIIFTRGDQSLEKTSSRVATPATSRPKLGKMKDSPILLEGTNCTAMERDHSLLFSDAYLAKKFTLSKYSSVLSSPGKRSKITSCCSNQSSRCSTKPARTSQARQREHCSDKTTPKKKKPRVSVKQMLRALASEKRVLPDAAVAEVVAVKKRHEAARTEMTELLEEIRAMEYDNYDGLPPDITASWIAAHAKQLRNSLDLQCTVLRHALESISTCKELPV